ncbi:Uncharacterised protein [Zhongshania aliphaticivorans]|nr:Uncharacterised protein [Zhongshania aliphaticivorans]
MRVFIVLSLMLSSIASNVMADTYTQGTGRDPRLRVAYFNARTHKPFDALIELAMAASKRGQTIDATSEMNAAFLAAANELGVSLSELGIKISHQNRSQNIESSAADIYANYNRGVSLLKSNTPLDGVSVLKEISVGEYVENDTVLLQDKTNLTLGYYFLESGDNRSAVHYFRQVRRLSMYANKALVGLGWALLSPNTGKESATTLDKLNASDLSSEGYLWSGSEDDIAWSRREAPFRRAWAIAKGEKEEDLRAAIVPWMELISRDPLDPAVQEVMLILPYLMLHWNGQEARAQQYYGAAVARLKQASQDLAKIEKAIRSGGLISSIRAADIDSNGWDIWLSELTANRLGGYLSLLLDSAEFRNTLQELRQLDLIYKRLNTLGGGRIEAALAEVDDARATLASELEKLALTRIVERRHRTEAYSAEAEFALARNYERLRLQLSGVVWSGGES